MMTAADILRALPTPLFTIADVAKFVSNPNVFLYRTGRKGYIRKIVNRIYWNVLFHPQPPAIESIACFSRQPSYISGEWALNYHGVLLQVPTVCTAITLQKTVGTRNRIRFGGNIIEYSRIKEQLYLPEQIQVMDGFLMATPEKALLDTLYLRRRIPFSDELETDELDMENLKSLSSYYPPIVAKRLKLFEGKMTNSPLPHSRQVKV